MRRARVAATTSPDDAERQQHDAEASAQTLPRGWKWMTIPELVGPAGIFVDGDWVESKDQDPHGDVRLIQLADVGDGVYRNRSNRFLTRSKARELGCTFLEPGDVLIARMPDPLGRACVFPGDDKPCVTVVDVAIARSGNGEFDQRWLAAFVNAQPFRVAVAGLQAGSTRKRISRGNLATLRLPVPPLREQQCVVTELEKQFTRLDAARSLVERSHANLSRYREAVLAAACEGCLVPTEPECATQVVHDQDWEDGAALLARVNSVRREGWKGTKYNAPVKPDTSSPVALPPGWALASLDELTSHITSGSRDWSQFYHRGPGTFILAQNVRTMRLDLTERQAVDAPANDAETERTRVRRDDILVTIVGAKTGDVCRVAVQLTDHFVCQSVALLRPVVSETAAFIELYLASRENGRAQWKKHIYGQGRPHLSFDQLRATAIPLPPLAEQRRIVEEVARRLSVVEEMESVVNINLQRVGSLRRSILQRAFSGQLV